jgi:hypothetical protein
MCASSMAACPVYMSCQEALGHEPKALSETDAANTQMCGWLWASNICTTRLSCRAATQPQSTATSAGSQQQGCTKICCCRCCCCCNKSWSRS